MEGWEITVFAEVGGNSSTHTRPHLPCTYSGTSPKPGAARASAAKILQYSLLMFWILHPCGLEETESNQQGTYPSSLSCLGPC